MGPTESRLRTVARALTWRAIAVIVAVALGWFLTGDLGKSLGFGLAYNAIQLLTQYAHDRWWARVEWGMLGLGDGDTAPAGRPLSVVAWSQAPGDALPERQANPAAPATAWAEPAAPWNGAPWASAEGLRERAEPELPGHATRHRGGRDEEPQRPYRSAS